LIDRIRRSQAKELLDLSTALLGLTALGIYAILRKGYDAFYDALGISAAEVGISEFDIITRAAVSLVLLMLLSATVYMLFVQTIRRIAVLGQGIAGTVHVIHTRYLQRRPRRQRRLRRNLQEVEGNQYLSIGGMLIAAMTILAAGLVSTIAESNYNAGRNIGAPDVVGWSLIGFAAVLLTLGALVMVTGSRLLAEVARSFADPAAITFGLWVLIVNSASYGSDAAYMARANQFESRGGLAAYVFDFRADTVCASWSGSDKPASLDLSHTLLYLGQSNGTTILYKSGDQTFRSPLAPPNGSGALRVPSSKVVLQAAGSTQGGTCMPLASNSPTPSPGQLCGAPPNPWHYTLCPGTNLVLNPPAQFCHVFQCVEFFASSPLGYVVRCADGRYSRAGGRSGACAAGHGEQRVLFQ
jgi:hypothetical protein